MQKFEQTYGEGQPAILWIKEAEELRSIEREINDIDSRYANLISYLKRSGKGTSDLCKMLGISEKAANTIWEKYEYHFSRSHREEKLAREALLMGTWSVNKNDNEWVWVDQRFGTVVRVPATKSTYEVNDELIYCILHPGAKYMGIRVNRNNLF